MARPVVALLTDFGTRDHYAGTLKGVVLSVCPDATLVDIAHDIPAHDVMSGALELAACYRYFPHGTIFLVVVDPGVGSSRRGVAADIGDYKFVAPDNGVLSAVFADTPPKKVVELTERKYALPTVSRTFEGRDRFAPAAGFLAKGVALVALGKTLPNYQTIALARPVADQGELRGSVVRVDRFGNLITDIDRRTFEQFSANASIAIEVGGREIPRIVGTYADAPPDELCALFGSTDHLEVAINAGDAAATLGLGRGAAARVRLVR
ncbi:MAG: S-adenosyl-l-methionine hydroxide adenosyltransferase family protein [Acidimicrobiia bacterium]